MQRNMHPVRRHPEAWKHADKHQEKPVSRKNDSTYNKNLGQPINRPRYRESEKRHGFMRSAKFGNGTFKHAVTKNNIQSFRMRRGIFPFKRNYEADVKYSDPRAAGIHPNQRQRENFQLSCDRTYWIPGKEKYEPINNQRCSTCPDTFQRDSHFQIQQKRWKFSHDFRTTRKFYHDDKFKNRNNNDHYAHQQTEKRRSSYTGNHKIKPEPLCETSSDGTKLDSFSCGTQMKVDLQSVEHATEDNFPENMVFGDFDEKMLKKEQEFLNKNSKEGCFNQDIVEHEIREQSVIYNQESSERDFYKQEQKVANYPLDLLEGFPLDLRFSRHGHAERLLQQNDFRNFPAVTYNDQNNNKMDQLHSIPGQSPRIHKQGIQRGHISELMVKQELQLGQNEDIEMQSTSPVWRSPPNVIINKINCTEETSVDKYCSSSGVGFLGNPLECSQESQRKLDENSNNISIIHSTREESIVNDASRETNERLNNYAPRDPRIRSKLADRIPNTCNQTLNSSSSNISSLPKTQHYYSRIDAKRQLERRQLKTSKPKLTINEVMEKYATSVSIYGIRWVMNMLDVDDEALEQRENEVISKALDPLGWCVPHEGLRACQQQRKNLVARRAAFSKFTEESLNSTKRLHMRIPQNHL